jgi:hypothetical protein
MSPLTRREFMKTFGVGLASLVIASCRRSSQDLKATQQSLRPTTQVLTCYEVVLYTPAPTLPPKLSPRNQLRLCWLSFNELAAITKSNANSNPEEAIENPFGGQLSTDHRRALDELVAAGEIDPAAADLVQEAYAAALYHVWRSNAPVTCYMPKEVDYAPTSAAQLLQQSSVLAEMAARSELNADTVAMAQKTIQHDLAFEALSPQEVNALYEQLLAEHQQDISTIPSFDQVELEVTPEMQVAAKFLVELLGRK